MFCSSPVGPPSRRLLLSIPRQWEYRKAIYLAVLLHSLAQGSVLLFAHCSTQKKKKSFAPIIPPLPAIAYGPTKYEESTVARIRDFRNYWPFSHILLSQPVVMRERERENLAMGECGSR